MTIHNKAENPMVRDNFVNVGPGITISGNTNNPLGVKVEMEPAHGFLQEGVKQMEARGALRDKPSGERSMASIVATFNALTGKDLTEAEGWEFMILLKMVRGRQGFYNRDDYVDGSCYFGLLGECESNILERRKN